MDWSTAPRRLVDERLKDMGTTANDLVMDIQDVRELREECRGRSWNELFQLALTWFGDKQKPQPKWRRRWTRPADEKTGFIGEGTWKGTLPPPGVT